MEHFTVYILYIASHDLHSSRNQAVLIQIQETTEVNVQKVPGAVPRTELALVNGAHCDSTGTEAH